MAGDGGDGDRRMDGWLSEKVQAQLGILAVPVEQRAVDRLGRARSCVRTHLSPALSRVSQHPRRDEESQSGLEVAGRLERRHFGRHHIAELN